MIGLFVIKVRKILRIRCRSARYFGKKTEIGRYKAESKERMPVGSDGGTVRIGQTATGRSDGGLGAAARRAGAAAERAGAAAERAGAAAERAGAAAERAGAAAERAGAAAERAGAADGSERRRGAQEQQAQDTAGRDTAGRDAAKKAGAAAERAGAAGRSGGRPGRRKIRENFCFPKIWLPLQPTARPNARNPPEKSSESNGAVRQVKPLNKNIMDEGPDQNCEFTDLFTNP